MYRMGDTIGHLKAIDIANKKVLWDVPSPLPFFSGMLATKGGVVFTGDQRGRLLAYDSKTGKEVWKFQTGSAINASPMTYELDESDMSRSCPDSAAIRASTIRRQRGACSGCSRSTARLMRAACTTSR
jgi:outer membrane protein assembly factor BamB